MNLDNKPKSANSRAWERALMLVIGGLLLCLLGLYIYFHWSLGGIVLNSNNSMIARRAMLHPQ